MAGTAPGVGESHSAVPSDCLGWPRRGGAFDMRDPAEFDDREKTRAVGGRMEIVEVRAALRG